MELDNKLNVEALLYVHPTNSKQEIDDLISESNRTIFVSGHRQVSLMAGRVKEIVDETADKWDVFFVEREKKEGKDRQKMDRSFTKVYQKVDKGKGKIGNIPDIIVKDNLPPLTQDTPPIISKTPSQMDSQLGEDKLEELKEDNPAPDILFTMNVDTRDFNIVMDKETTEVKKSECIPDNTQLNTEIPAEEEVETRTKIGHEQNISEREDSKIESMVENKNENKNENKEEKLDKEVVKDGSKEVEVVKVIVQTFGEEKKPIAEPCTPPSTFTMDYGPSKVIDVLLDSIKRITDAMP